LLSGFEDSLSTEWPKCLDGDERAFRVISAFWRIIQRAATQHNADVILIDLGPNLGAINRAALIAADYVAVPLAPDLFSLQGLRNLGPTLQKWRNGWGDRLERAPADIDIQLPEGSMQPIGYIVLQHAERLSRPIQAYGRWIARIPGEYREHVLQEPGDDTIAIKNDPHCLASLTHYRSLMPLAHEARKPMFHLKPADGAMGAHMQAVRGVEKDFQTLAAQIARQTNIQFPAPQ
jgi:cellulose biosynthesis protein BcsQ